MLKQISKVRIQNNKHKDFELLKGYNQLVVTKSDSWSAYGNRFLKTPNTSQKVSLCFNISFIMPFTTDTTSKLAHMVIHKSTQKYSHGFPLHNIRRVFLTKICPQAGNQMQRPINGLFTQDSDIPQTELRHFVFLNPCIPCTLT